MKIKYTAFFLLSFAYVACVKNASAQPLRYYPSVRGAEMLNGKDTLQNAWAGGFVNPQFSNIDANFDGRNDVVVFEPVDNKISVFISLSGGGLRYMPEYDNMFPELQTWVLFVDYDKDGKADIFTYAKKGGGMDVFRNTSTGGKLSFKKVADVLYYEDIQFDLNLYVPSSDIPAITDMDNDGDIDILSYDVLQTQVQYYRNMSVERYGKPDSLDLRIEDRCWGKFAESSSTNSVDLGQSCGKVRKRGAVHGGSTLLAIDVDGDGDKDLLTGDTGYDNLSFLKNGRIDASGGTNIDSIISATSTWPSSGPDQAEVTLYAAPFYVDIDADGVNDLIVSPMEQNSSIAKNNILYYKNSGTNASPNFKFEGNNFLLNSMFSGEIFSMPAFLDYNGDGLQDLVVSVKLNAGPTYNTSKLMLYKNVGTQAKAVFSLVSSDFGKASFKLKPLLAPAFADLNGDGKTDMVLGTDYGEILFYINTGNDTGGIPKMLETSSFGTITVGQNAKPALADINRDGLTDLVIGDLNGSFHYYKNTGTTTQAAFTLITDSFGKARTNKYYWDYVYNSQGKPIDSTYKAESFGYSSPSIADLDGDGKWDMVSGTTYGELFFYMNIEDHVNDSFTYFKNAFYNKLTSADESKSAGLISVPAVAKLNDDNKPEILVGNYRGGMYYYSSKEVVLGIEDHEKLNNNISLKVYPNPAKKHLYIRLPENTSAPQNGVITLYDVMGRQIVNQKVTLMPGRDFKLDIPETASGIYMLQFNGQKHFSEKIYMQ